MSRVTEIRYVGYGVPDLQAERAFYQRPMGPARSRGAGRHGLFRRPRHRTNSTSFGCARPKTSASTSSPLRQTAGPMSTRSSARFATAGCKVIFEPHDARRLWRRLRFPLLQPDGLPFEISADVERGVSRALVRWEGIPQKISHIVLHSPNHKGAVQFFTDVLGFKAQRLAGRLHGLPALQRMASPDRHLAGTSVPQPRRLRHAQRRRHDAGYLPG